MKPYTKKAIALVLFIKIGLFVANWRAHAQLSPVAFVGVAYIGCLFVLVHYFTHHDKNMSENKKIRRLMIGSMIRLFFVLIYLGISLFNSPQFSLNFVIAFGLSFIFFLFFDIVEMRINLRPDLKKPNKNTND